MWNEVKGKGAAASGTLASVIDGQGQSRPQRRPSPHVTHHTTQPEIRSAFHMPFYGILWHIDARCEAISPRSAS